jgi:8-oxo-dGTP pyrophosphatase MutT (NUDIX family)
LSRDPDQTVHPREAETTARQVAALVWRRTDSGPDVLLVTSRTTRRWLLPKGWRDDGFSDAQSAAQEAFEEAGAVTAQDDGILGTYRYDKILDDGSRLPCTVDVFGFKLVRLADHWPEMTQRVRRWYAAETAASLVAEPELAALISSLERTSKTHA